MNRSPRRHRPGTHARRWHAKVHEAVAELAHRIELIEAQSGKTRDGADRMSALARLRACVSGLV